MAPVGADGRVLRKGGVWSVAGVGSWLGTDVQDAIVSSGCPADLEGPRPDVAGTMRKLVRGRFEQVTVMRTALGMDNQALRRRRSRALR